MAIGEHVTLSSPAYSSSIMPRLTSILSFCDPVAAVTERVLEIEVSSLFPSSPSLLASLRLPSFLFQADAAIPTRANKSKGTRSKKDLREEVSPSNVSPPTLEFADLLFHLRSQAQAEAAAELKALAISSGDTCGKWLIFRDGSKVDGYVRDTSLLRHTMSTDFDDASSFVLLPSESSPFSPSLSSMDLSARRSAD